MADESFNANGLAWAVSRWQAEVSLRPLVNVHRRALDDTWRQVIRYFGGDPAKLLGPSHDALVNTPEGQKQFRAAAAASLHQPEGGKTE